VECGAAAVNVNTNKHGSSSFSALHPKMTSQYSDVLRQWYPYVVSQRTIVSRAVEVFNGAGRLAGMALAAVASCLAETANSAKTLLENAQKLAELQVRRRGRSSETSKTLDSYFDQPTPSNSEATDSGVDTDTGNTDTGNDKGKCCCCCCCCCVFAGECSLALIIFRLKRIANETDSHTL
jgi:hypothetical protein